MSARHHVAGVALAGLLERVAWVALAAALERGARVALAAARARSACVALAAALAAGGCARPERDRSPTAQDDAPRVAADSAARPDAVAEAAPSAAARALVPVALPAPRHGHRLELVGGGLLAFGGFGDAATPDRETRQTWWLAPGAVAWQRRADLLEGRAFFASATLDGAVFAVGGGIERYDLAADRWSELVPAGRLPVSHFAAAAVGATLYVLGGYGGPSDALHVVDLASGAVVEAPPPPGFGAGDHFHCLHALGGRLHVVGGLDGETFDPKAEHWVLGERGFEPGPPPPVPVWAKFAVQAVADGALYLFGDFGGWRFDPRSGAWEPRAPLPSPLVMPPAVALGDAIWVVGGVALDGGGGSILLRYDLRRDAW